MANPNPEEENAFRKIMTTAPGDMPKGAKRQQSWMETLRRTASVSENDLIDCPSCRGTGMKEVSNELVALIPYNDERLKPRRTKLKIAIALLVCAVLLGVLTYIFLPGKVFLVITNLTLYRAHIAKPWSLEPNAVNSNSSLSWVLTANVTNHNRFLPVTIEGTNVTLKRIGREMVIVGTLQLGNYTVGAAATDTQTFQFHNTTGYSDIVLNCMCCVSYQAFDSVVMVVTSTIQYSLKLFGMTYFTSFASDETIKGDNCNYLKEMDKNKTISCDIYNFCGMDN